MVNHIDDRPLVAPIGEDGNPVLQVDRLEAVTKHALSSDNWYQGSWIKVQQGQETACGTSYCIAGFAAVEFAGLTPTAVDSDGETGFVQDHNGETRNVSIVASDYLGLNRAEAATLFAPYNSAEDVEILTEEIKNGTYR